MQVRCRRSILFSCVGVMLFVFRNFFFFCVFVYQKTTHKKIRKKSPQIQSLKVLFFLLVLTKWNSLKLQNENKNQGKEREKLLKEDMAHLQCFEQNHQFFRFFFLNVCVCVCVCVFMCV